jgi:hypothetical protein
VLQIGKQKKPETYQHPYVYEVLTAVNVKITVFWEVIPFCLVDRYQRFERKYCPLLEGKRVTKKITVFWDVALS